VRRDQLGDKALVHNYGHGGAGITLSWGTSRLAASLGLQGHSGPVAVIGAGVMGLTTARLVQEAGLPVTIYTADLPPDTTSNLAGGQWGPTGHYREAAVTPEWRSQYRAALAVSWERFQKLDGARYGVRWLPTYTDSDRVGSPSLQPYYPESRILASADHPFAVTDIAVYRTMYVEVGRYMAQLTEDFLRAGGQMRIRRFAGAADLSELPERLVFNCTGLGSRELFGDIELGPVRGQIVMLAPQPLVQYAYTLPAGYMFPRADGIVLGGTFERGEWSTAAEPATVQRILASHRNLFSNFRCVA
jgi:D-amino-acid oxidase